MGPRTYLLKYSDQGEIHIIELESFTDTMALSQASQAIGVLDRVSSAVFISLGVKHDW